MVIRIALIAVIGASAALVAGETAPVANTAYVTHTFAPTAQQVTASAGIGR